MSKSMSQEVRIPAGREVLDGNLTIVDEASDGSAPRALMRNITANRKKNKRRFIEKSSFRS